MASPGDIYDPFGGLSAGEWIAQQPANPRGQNDQQINGGWTPFKQGQLKAGDAGYDATWDPNTQSSAPQRGYVMGGYAAPQASDAQGNGVDPLSDPNNKAWGNGESYNEHVADIGNRNAQSQQYNAGEDARYAKEMQGWSAAHPTQATQGPQRSLQSAMQPTAPPVAPTPPAQQPVQAMGGATAPREGRPLSGFMAGAKAPNPSMPAPSTGETGGASSGGGFGGGVPAARRSRFGGAGGWGKLF